MGPRARSSHNLAGCRFFPVSFVEAIADPEEAATRAAEEPMTRVAIQVPACPETPASTLLV